MASAAPHSGSDTETSLHEPLISTHSLSGKNIKYVHHKSQGMRLDQSAHHRQHTNPPDHHKEMQTAVVWSCLPFIRSGQNHLARHSERGRKARQTEEKVGRQHQGMDRPGVGQVPVGSGEQGKKWRKLVAKSSVVPQRPSRLRDS